MKRTQLAALTALTLIGALAPLVRLVPPLSRLFAPLQELEAASLSARFQLRGPLKSQSKVVVVAIDNATEHAWRAIPRGFWGSELAKVLQKIDAAGASRVGLDYLITVDADTYLANQGSRATPNLDLDNALAALEGRVVLATITGEEILPQLKLAPNRAWGSANTLPSTFDTRGVVWRVPRVDRYFSPPLAGFAALLAQAPRGDDRPIEINYSGTPHSAVVSAWDLLEGRVPAETLRGAVVLLGETSDLSTDRQDTPFGPTPGVLIQAEAVKTLLENRELRPCPLALEVVLGAFVSALFALLAIRTTGGRYLSVALGFGLTWSVLVVALFGSHSVVLPWLPPLAMALLGVPLVVFPLKIADERTERLWVRAQWGQMVSDEFVTILEARRSSGLGAMATFPAALLFLDIANFSSLTNQMSPDAILEGLNRLFERAIREIQAQGGTVLNFTGDGLSAMFVQKPDAPTSAALDAALASALAILKQVDWEVRMGLAFGEVTLSLVGSPSRKQMTVYGPAINMASRLEQAGKDLTPERLLDQPPLQSALVVSSDFQSAALFPQANLVAKSYHPKGWPEPLCVFYLPPSR